MLRNSRTKIASCSHTTRNGSRSHERSTRSYRRRPGNHRSRPLTKPGISLMKNTIGCKRTSQSASRIHNVGALRTFRGLLRAHQAATLRSHQRGNSVRLYFPIINGGVLTEAIDSAPFYSNPQTNEFTKMLQVPNKITHSGQVEGSG